MSEPHASVRRVSGLIFDMGDVFCDVTHWRRALASDLARRGYDATYPLLVERWEARLVPVYKGRRDYWEAFDDLLGDFDVPIDERDAIKSEARRVAADLPERTLFDGVADTLEELAARGVKLAVLSDTESTEIKVRKSLAKLGIEAPFDAVLTSRDLGAVKPEPAAFGAAVAALGLAVGDCGFVGHDIDELEGAHRYGLLAFGYNYAPGAPADVYLDRFSGLLDLVR